MLRYIKFYKTHNNAAACKEWVGGISLYKLTNRPPLSRNDYQNLCLAPSPHTANR